MVEVKRGPLAPLRRAESERIAPQIAGHIGIHTINTVVDELVMPRLQPGHGIGLTPVTQKDDGIIQRGARKFIRRERDQRRLFGKAVIRHMSQHPHPAMRGQSDEMWILIKGKAEPGARSLCCLLGRDPRCHLRRDDSCWNAARACHALLIAAVLVVIRHRVPAN
jgi:hypothetical protein